MSFSREGILFLLVGPAGGGKNTVEDHLLSVFSPGLRQLVTATTRKPRDGEVPGVSYHFFSRADFEQGIRDNHFLEWQETHGNLYGTPRSSIEPLQAEALDIVSDIDFRGIEFYKRTYPKTVVSIFVVPSTAQELIRRLTLRGDAKGDITTRVGTAEREMMSFQTMPAIIDYVLINDDKATTLRHAESIVMAERLRRDRLSAAHLSTICSVTELQSFRAG